jgi:hypothetical protein
VVESNQQYSTEAGSHDHRNFNYKAKAEASQAAIKAKYLKKIKTAEGDLLYLTKTKDEIGGVANRSKNLDNSIQHGIDAAAESKAASRALEYEIDVARDRVNAEEARDALWRVWSEAAERRGSHLVKDQSIVAALDLVRSSRHKITATVQSCVRNEAAADPTALIPAWLKNEPIWPAILEHDISAWQPSKTATDTEKTLAALIRSAERAVEFAKKCIYGRSAEPARYDSQQLKTRGNLALISAQEAQQGSAKVISALNSAAKNLMDL